MWHRPQPEGAGSPRRFNLAIEIGRIDQRDEDVRTGRIRDAMTGSLSTCLAVISTDSLLRNSGTVSMAA